MDKINWLTHDMNCSTVFLNEKSRLEQILACLEETEGFMPTHFGVGDQSKFSYERQATIDFIYEMHSIKIWGRSKLSRYELSFRLNKDFNTVFRLEMRDVFKDKIVPLFFDLGEKLARVCQPIWFSSYYYLKQDDVDSSCLSEEDRLQYDKQKQLESWMCHGQYSWNYGFTGTGMVSYMQSEIAQQLGMDYLKAAPAIVQELPNGLVKVALCEKPWEENWFDLLDKWVELTTYLAQTGFVTIPHVEVWEECNDVSFIMSQKGFAFKEAMREKYLAEGKPVPECFERHSMYKIMYYPVYDVGDFEKIFNAPYLIEIPGMKESERYVLEHIKKEEWV